MSVSNKIEIINDLITQIKKLDGEMDIFIKQADKSYLDNNYHTFNVVIKFPEHNEAFGNLARNRFLTPVEEFRLHMTILYVYVHKNIDIRPIRNEIMDYVNKNKLKDINLSSAGFIKLPENEPRYLALKFSDNSNTVKSYIKNLQNKLIDTLGLTSIDKNTTDFALEFNTFRSKDNKIIIRNQGNDPLLHVTLNEKNQTVEIMDLSSGPQIPDEQTVIQIKKGEINYSAQFKDMQNPKKLIPKSGKTWTEQEAWLVLKNSGVNQGFVKPCDKTDLKKGYCVYVYDSNINTSNEYQIK